PERGSLLAIFHMRLRLGSGQALAFDAKLESAAVVTGPEGFDEAEQRAIFRPRRQEGLALADSIPPVPHWRAFRRDETSLRELHDVVEEARDRDVRQGELISGEEGAVAEDFIEGRYGPACIAKHRLGWCRIDPLAQDHCRQVAVDDPRAERDGSF